MIVIPESDRFVRLPTALLAALLRARLTGAQCRIILWVVRQTYGWHRSTTPFSWYRIAVDLGMDRGGVVRAGHRLLRSGILWLEDGQLGIGDGTKHSRLERAMTGVSADWRHRKAMTGILASDDSSQRKRCQESSLFRRAKDSSKERIKIYRKTAVALEDAPQRAQNGAFRERRHPAGTARPVLGKYDGLSQN